MKPSDLIAESVVITKSDTMETRRSTCQIIDGEPYLTFVNPDTLRRALRFQPQEGDIIQVTFPRSGTHWVQQIIQLILNRGESAKNLLEFARRAPFIEFHDEEAFEGLDAPRLIRTHLRLGQIPFGYKAKYVYVARNPWDCCVSSYHFLVQLPEFQVNYTFDEHLDIFLRGETGAGDHLNHVLSGYTRQMEPNVFFVTYEELKRDTSGTVKRLAHFIGAEHGKAVDENQGLLRTILEKSSAEYMKSIIKTNQKGFTEMFHKNEKMKPVTPRESEARDVAFVREGNVGGWKGSFTRDQLRRMEARILEVSQTSDIMHLWEEEWLCAKKRIE